MPELPEVETVRRGLNLVTLHQEIQGGDVLLSRTIAYPASGMEFLSGLKGSTIAQWHRRGKYLLAELIKQKAEGGTQSSVPSPQFPVSTQKLELKTHNSYPPPPTPHPTPAGFLGVHLRMTGQLLWLNQSEPLQKHTRVRLFFANGQELRFVDQRTFGQMWWVPPDHSPELIMTGLQHLGPEPFSEDFSLPYFMHQLKHRRRPIKNALLDQAIVAGIGNIYADEALFLSGIHPNTLCVDLNRKKLDRLRTNILQVLQTSIDAKGTSFSTFRNVEGVNGNYGGVAWVYARDGETCRTCGTVIERIRMAGRSAHFCPKCQRGKDKG
ncbi:DNA-formamidopyrimidine glycosylase [Kovacikia minuta CCNUW1]|nr:DNA-formamidopyrimidine glycosylase [Kovacikia minuta]UBF29512.1 DNA-formamidopyrimidine glycosylase [Kovacikia minuta CCNUW1]